LHTSTNDEAVSTTYYSYYYYYSLTTIRAVLVGTTPAYKHTQDSDPIPNTKYYEEPHQDPRRQESRQQQQQRQGHHPEEEVIIEEAEGVQAVGRGGFADQGDQKVRGAEVGTRSEESQHDDGGREIEADRDRAVRMGQEGTALRIGVRQGPGAPQTPHRTVGRRGRFDALRTDRQDDLDGGVQSHGTGLRPQAGNVPRRQVLRVGHRRTDRFRAARSRPLLRRPRGIGKGDEGMGHHHQESQETGKGSREMSSRHPSSQNDVREEEGRCQQ